VAGEISRRESGGLRRARPAELSPYQARRVAQITDDDAGAAVIAQAYIENAAEIVERAIELTAHLSAEAEAQPAYTPFDHERYQMFVNAFMQVAHRTIRAYGERI
jgi:hypothetical protein